MSNIIEATELSKWFGEVVAVNNLSIEIDGGVVGVLGPNGAGKTTFIKLALGLYAPSRGSIKLFGEPPRNNGKVLRRIAYCPEHDKFYDNMTGYEFVSWMNRFGGMSADAAGRHAEEACELVRMTDRMDDLITTYSMGMRQRIKIAQSLSLDSELLFLDEPMAGLDPEGREEMFALVRKLGDEGRCVVFSSHILYEIERVTDNVVLLHNGCILARGNVRHIRELIDEHPHAVTVKCSDPRALAREFVLDSTTLSEEFCDGNVTIQTSAPNEFYQKLNEVVIDGKIKIESIHCPDDNLQSVFDYLVK